MSLFCPGTRPEMSYFVPKVSQDMSRDKLVDPLAELIRGR
jgi:hypothetical protein